jgi:hypothetical protein
MKQEINVPTSLNEITLEQYQTFMRINDANDSEEFIAQKMVSIFCKIKLSQVLYIRASDVASIVASFTKLLQTDKKLITRFELGGKEFGFIPNLEDMSFGEYIDLETNLGEWDSMHKAMAVMFRPITQKKGDKYEIEPYNGTANYSDVMKYVPLDVVLGAMVFFCHLSDELLKATLSYLTDQAEAMDILPKNNLTNNGDGITQSMHSLREMSSSLTRLLQWDYLNV